MSYGETKPYFDHIKQTLMYEVPNQIERFDLPISYSYWEYSMEVIDQFLRNRPDAIIPALKDFVSIEESKDDMFLCYPNPSSGEICLFVDANVLPASEIAIYDLLGRKVFSTSMPNPNARGKSNIVIRPDLKAGIYLLKIGDLVQRIVRY